MGRDLSIRSCSFLSGGALLSLNVRSMVYSGLMSSTIFLLPVAQKVDEGIRTATVLPVVESRAGISTAHGPHVAVGLV